MVTMKKTAKDLANFGKTKIELWYDKIKKEYGQDGIQFLIKEENWQRKLKGGEPVFRTFSQNMYDFLIAKENGYPCQKQIRYLNRKDRAYQIDSLTALLDVSFFVKNF